MCRQGASREECERVHADLSIPPVFRRNPELAHWYDQRRQRLARLDAFRTVHMGKLAVGGLYAWMALCYYALVHTVLLPLFLGEGSTTSSFFLQRLFLACGFVAFTSVLALVVVLHVLLLRSSPGHVPPSWVPSAAPMQRQHEEGNAATETPPVQVSVVVVAPSPDTPRLALPMNIVPNDEGKEEEEEEEEDEGKGSQQWQDYCSKCNSLRPLRARHCRVCNRCILKMDHHCPWINNCVGNNNFKLFFLFLCAACTLGVGACLLFLLGGFHFWHHVHTMSSDVFWWRGTLLLVNWWVSLAATAHIAMMTGHMWVNMSENATTIEQISFGPQRRRHRLNPFDLGREANVVQVMGNTSFWRWWLHPLAPPATDGFSFLMHSQ